MENVSVRLRVGLRNQLEREARSHGVTRSEYLRSIIEDRHRVEELEAEIEELEDALAARERRIEELEQQLAESVRGEQTREAEPESTAAGSTRWLERIRWGG